MDFVHFNGMTGELLLPEMIGSGGAVLDYDNDGDLDLYLVQGAILRPGKKLSEAIFPWQGATPPQDRLYRNDLVVHPDGRRSLRFTDVTRQSGIAATGYGFGVATGDFNNDGWMDLYVTNLHSNQMFRNNGNGTFTDVTQKAGTDDVRWSTSAAFIDYDRDGWLDLFVANYVKFSVDENVNCYADSSAPDYCGPDAYDPLPDRLFHNSGDGTFTDVSISSGIYRAFGAGFGVVTADLDGDGWMDIYVANDGDPNQLWINQRDGTFREKALLAGVALNRMGQAEAGMGVDAGDFDGDGDDDVFLTHLAEETNTLYVNVGNGFFEDRTIEAGLHSPSLRYTGFGTAWFDYDNDGWLDLLALNGAVRIQEHQARHGDPYPLGQPNQLFRNTGGATFVETTDQADSSLRLEEVSRGAAFGDLDNDGDTDVVIVNNSGPARLLQNRIGNHHHWLGLRLVGKREGRDMLHARVAILGASGRILWRRARCDGSYCSANDPRVLVGLGVSEEPRTVRVYWPGGSVEEWKGLRVDRYFTLKEGQAPKE